MLERIFSLFQSPKREDSAAAENDAGALHRAVAALLVEAARIDERYDAREKSIIDQTLSSTFAIALEDAAALRAEGEAAQGDALDIQRFTKIAKKMPITERIALVERLWEIILSDGERDPHEDALMRRICGLIYVDDRDSGAARARAAARLESS